MTTTDVLIVGQGLAGSTLAWQLAALGVRCVVVDRGGVDHAGMPTASRVAAGLITPVTGGRLAIAADWDALWRSAEALYRRIQRETGARLLHTRPALRVLASPAERRKFEERQRFAERLARPPGAGPSFARHARPATTDELPAGLRAEHGAFWMPHAARLDVAGLVDATRAWLEADGRYRRAEVDPETDFQFSPAGVAVPRLGLSAACVVFCQGYTPTPPRWLTHLRFTPAKGELLTVVPTGATPRQVTHRGVWLAPEADAPGRPHACLVGATFAWDRLDGTPTAAAREELLAKAAPLLGATPRVIDHRAAVRPAMAGRRPTLGFATGEPRVAWLNGLGTKGALWAPWHAGQLAQQLAGRLSAAGSGC
ncbi:MAG: FAD-dependent oxidoreductase [Planctomycetota bacterium]